MIGIEASLYRNTGTYGSPTWAELMCVSDCAVNPAWDTAEALIRAARVKMRRKTLLGIEIPAKLLKTVTGDTGLIALQDAMNDDSEIDILALDKDTTTVGSRGWRFYTQVYQSNQSQNPGDLLYEDMIFAPTIPTDGNYPKHAEVTAGPALTFTAIGTAP